LEKRECEVKLDRTEASTLGSMHSFKLKEMKRSENCSD